jgi:hypothetical protein
MKNSNDTIGNRTRNLPACSVVPQPNAPPHTPKSYRHIPKVKHEADMQWRRRTFYRTQSLTCEIRLVELLHRSYSKTGSMARWGISGSRLHLLHLSATAPSAPLARSFHLDCVQDRCSARATIETKQQSRAPSIRYWICSSKCFMSTQM